jgi:hypothetical protein
MATGDPQGSPADADPNMTSAGSRLRPRQTNQVGIYFLCLERPALGSNRGGIPESGRF